MTYSAITIMFSVSRSKGSDKFLIPIWQDCGCIEASYRSPAPQFHWPNTLPYFLSTNVCLFLSGASTHLIHSPAALHSPIALSPTRCLFNRMVNKLWPHLRPFLNELIDRCWNILILLMNPFFISNLIIGRKTSTNQHTPNHFNRFRRSAKQKPLLFPIGLQVFPPF